MHIYGFGSICRGEVDQNSDVDLLSLVDRFDPRFDPSIFSIYSYGKIECIWAEGNPFAWHLHIESKLLYSQDGIDFIKELGKPSKYNQGRIDCDKFREIFNRALRALEEGTMSQVFELSNMFLAIRNFATCYSLQFSDEPDFSRYSALRLKNGPVPIRHEIFEILERARILSTRGAGTLLSKSEILSVIEEAFRADDWMNELLAKADEN